jgi:hypothetical protein
MREKTTFLHVFVEFHSIRMKSTRTRLPWNQLKELVKETSRR